MDMKIAGSGTIAAGEYGNIRISGSGRLGGAVRCQSFHCSGAARCEGSMEALGDIRISGSARFEQDVRARDIVISGSTRIEGPCTVSNLNISGYLRCDGNIKGTDITVSGAARADSIEGEDVLVNGQLTCERRLFADHIVINMDGTTSEIGSIGGGSIRICPQNSRRRFARLPLLSKLFGGKKSRLTVEDAIEGDEIVLEQVTADRVTGRVVTVGEGCRIGLVQYSEALELSRSAKVERQERIFQ